MTKNGASALPSELAHLAVPVSPVPAAPAAPPRPRLSLLALLGFLLGGALFIGGTAATAFTAWATDGGFASLDEGLQDGGGRHTIEEIVTHPAPPEARAALFGITTAALVATGLILALNGGTFFSIGRKVGLRGGGYALMGFLMTGVAGLEVAKLAETWRAPIARWQQLDSDPNLLATAQTPSANRLDDLLKVSAVSRRGAEGLPALKVTVQTHPAPSVRYGAAFALGVAAASTNPGERDAARAGLEVGLNDRNPAVREISKWGLEDPATRSQRDWQPTRRRVRVEAQGSAF